MGAADIKIFAIKTPDDAVVLGKAVPMLSLGGRQDSRSLTEGTHILQGGQKGPADEFRTIGHGMKKLCQIRICLKGENFLLGFSHTLRVACLGPGVNRRPAEIPWGGGRSAEG